MELITGTDGKLTAEQVPTPTKEHYTFDGWYTAASGGTLLSLDTVYTDSSSKYYARWTENPALTGTATITGTAVSWNNTDNAEYRLYDGSTSDADIKAEWKAGTYTTALAYTPVKGGITLNADGKRHDQTFTFDTIPEGNYKLVIFKPGKYVPKIVSITVSTTDYDCGQLKLWLKGDVNGDGIVNGNDIQRLYSHITGASTLTADDALIVANANEDTAINGNDIQRIFAHIVGSNIFSD